VNDVTPSLSPPLIVAVSDDPVSEIGRAVGSDELGSRRTAVDRQHGIAVSWSTDVPWVTATDEADEIVVVVDGRIHHPDVGADPAEWARERYLSRGDGLARGMLGDVVVVVLDRVRGRVLVARDPLGVRPWYQAAARRKYLGASTLGAVANGSWVDTDIDDRVAIEHLAAREESRGPTLYRGIKTLGPGSTSIVDEQGMRTIHHHRWSIEPDTSISWGDAVERCREIFRQAVDDRVRAAGPIASELSGGLDSSTVVGALVTGHDIDPLVARLVFETPGADERRYSDAVLQRYGLEGLSITPWKPNVGEFDTLTRRFRAPVPDPNFTMFVPVYEAFARAGRFDWFSGLGGDDAFVATSVGGRVVSAFQQRDRAQVAKLLRTVLERPKDAWRSLIKPTAHHLAPWKHARPPAWIRSEVLTATGFDRLYRQPPEPLTGIAAIDERIANLTSGYDAGVLERRAVIEHLGGARGTHPFLDPRFIEATYGLDPSWPTRGGHDRAMEIAAFGDLLPDLVADRRTKAGFAEVFWPQVLPAPQLEAVRTGPLAEKGWLDAAGFEVLVSDARNGMARTAIPLARCLSLDRWLRTI
jgi:asparagine synthase (glutamine-hydrolysing)